MKNILISITLVSVLFGQASGQAATDVPTELPPGWWKIPKTNIQMKIGGYVKLDMIHDFNPIGSPDYFDVSKIPTDDSKGESTHLHAKETRLFIDTRTASKVGEVRVYVEGDFYGPSGALRLRHAFVEIGGKLLAGQWWSNFMDENIIPSTLDFEKPAAYAFARHAMLRWKQSLSKDAYLAFALEEPSANGQAPTEAGKFESPLPDFTARYRVTKKWGHVQLSGFAALVRYRYDAGGKDDVSLVGGNLSGQFNLLKKDNIIYQVVYGPGIGRYRGGISTGLDNNENLEAITDTGITIGYQHYWNTAFSSLVVYNQGTNNTTAGQPENNLSHTRYFAANLLWHFADNAFVGMEYLWGNREDISGESGTANRLQFSVRYGIN